MSDIANDAGEEAEIALEYEFDAAIEGMARHSRSGLSRAMAAQGTSPSHRTIASFLPGGSRSSTECGRRALHFQTAPNVPHRAGAKGGTLFRIIHRMAGGDARPNRAPTTTFAP